MKLLSLALTLGLILVATPALARNHSGNHKKCKIEGTYAGTFSDGSITVTQFFADGTVILTNNGESYWGTWKCVGSKCYAFCIVSEFIEGFHKLAGTLCFAEDCKTTHAYHEAQF
jgi:hypothetical protein